MNDTVLSDLSHGVHTITLNRPAALNAMRTELVGALVDAFEAANADPETRARGAALYERFACADCHEPERAAEGVVAVPLTELEQRYDADSLAAFLEHPAPAMPVFPTGVETHLVVDVSGFPLVTFERVAGRQTVDPRPFCQCRANDGKDLPGGAD